MGKAAVTVSPDVVIERHPFELRVLTQIPKALTSRLPLPELLHQAMDRLNASLGPADVKIIYLRDGSSGVLRASASFGCDADALREVVLEAGESIPGEGFAEGHAQLYSSVNAVTNAMVDLRLCPLPASEGRGGSGAPAAHRHRPRRRLHADLARGAAAAGLIPGADRTTGIAGSLMGVAAQ